MITADYYMSKFYLEGSVDLSKTEIGFLCLAKRGKEFRQHTINGSGIVFLEGLPLLFCVGISQVPHISTQKVKFLEEGLGFIRPFELSRETCSELEGVSTVDSVLLFEVTEQGKEYLDTLPLLTKLLGVQLWHLGETSTLFEEHVTALAELPELLACDNYFIRRLASERFKELQLTDYGEKE